MAALQAAAYLLVLLPLPFGFNRFEGFTLIKYQLITASNAFAAPALLLLVVLVLRSRVYVLAHHLVQLFVLLSVAMYARYFDALPHINLLRQIGALPAVGRHVLVQLVGWREVATVALLVVSCVLASLLVGRVRGRRRPRRLVAALVAILLLIAVKDFVLDTRLPIWKYRYDGIYFLKRYGFVPILSLQLAGELRARPHDVRWPGEISADNCREVTFPPTRPNVIFLQVESLDPWVIDHQVGGTAVMPFLCEWRTRSLAFVNFFAQHRGGGSADAELSCLTGLLPLTSHTGFLTADFSRVISLPEILDTLGTYTCAMHANAGSYFYRRPAFRRLGFDDFFDRASYTGAAAGWGSKDRAFFEQSLAILDRSPRPFFAYLITMQSHGPFDNHGQPSGTFLPSQDEDALTRDYLLTMHEVDDALATFLGGLARRGELSNTLVFIFADHASGVTPRARAGATLRPGDHDRVPLFVTGPGVAPGVSTKVGSHLDLGPTLLHLIGAPPIAYSMGRSLLDPGVGRVFLSSGGAVIILRNAGRDSPELVVERDLSPWAPFLDFSESVLHP